MAQVGRFSEELETLSQVLSLVEAFRAFDADDDNFINVAELRGIMGSLGYNPREEDIERMMEQGDKNKDGLLSIQEFLDTNTKQLEIGHLADILERAFDALNSEGNEVVTAEELHEVTAHLGCHPSLGVCREIIASMDGDGDGAISIEDFLLIVKPLL